MLGESVRELASVGALTRRGAFRTSRCLTIRRSCGCSCQIVCSVRCPARKLPRRRLLLLVMCSHGMCVMSCSPFEDFKVLHQPFVLNLVEVVCYSFVFECQAANCLVVAGMARGFELGS